MTHSRTLLAATCLSLAGPVAAGAADFASLNVIGYSADGSTFVFEEYGIQDGSGFGYSNIYAVDLNRDAYVPGTPVRILEKTEGALKEARRKAADKIAPLLDKLQTGDRPGYIAAYNPPTEIDAHPNDVRFYDHPNLLVAERQYQLTLTKVPFDLPARCEGLTKVHNGFRLTYMFEAGQKASRVLYEDQRVPESRGCARDYRIGAVITDFQASAMPVAMILLSTFGFEGDDYRWIAVPLPAASR